MLFLKIWNLPTGFSLKELANFFSLPKLKICGNVCFQTCVCFQVPWSKAIKLTPTENKKCMKKCSSTQVFPYPPSCSKEAYKTGSNFLYLPFFSALRLSGVDDVRWVQRKSVLQLAICVSCT